MDTTRTITTADELLDAGDIGRCELIRGKLIMMSPAGDEHGRVAMNIAAMLWNHVRAHDLGVTHTAETGFLIERDRDTVLAPDASFIAKARAAKPSKRFVVGPPDLAVEVVSPSESERAVSDKVQLWLDAGTRQVWVIDPDPRTVTIHQPSAPSRTLTERDTLTGGDLLPGFTVDVGAIFAA